MDSKLIRLALILALSLPAFGQGKILAPIFFGQPASAGVVWPSAFSYIASSVTGCLNDTSTQTKCVSALHQTPGAGHLLVLIAQWNSTAAATVTITDPNNTWVAIGSARVGVGDLTDYSGQMFYVPSAAASATTVTMTASGNSNLVGWEVAEYSYTGTIANLDPTNGTGFNYSTTVASGGGIATVNSAANTQGSSDLLVAGCFVVDSGCSVGSGYMSRNDTNACHYNGTTCTSGFNWAGGTGALYEEKTGVAAGAQSATFGTSAGDNVVIGLVAF